MLDFFILSGKFSKQFFKAIFFYHIILAINLCHVQVIYFLLHALYAINSNFVCILLFFRQISISSNIIPVLPIKYIIKLYQAHKGRGIMEHLFSNKFWKVEIQKFVYWNWKVCYTQSHEYCQKRRNVVPTKGKLHECIYHHLVGMQNIPYLTTQHQVQNFSLPRLKQVYVRRAFKMRYAHKVLIIISITTHNELLKKYIDVDIRIDVFDIKDQKIVVVDL